MHSRRRSGLSSLQDYDQGSPNFMPSELHGGTERHTNQGHRVKQEFEKAEYEATRTQSQFGSRLMEGSKGRGLSSVGMYKEKLESPQGAMGGGGPVAPKSKGKDLFFQNKVRTEIDTLRFISSHRTKCASLSDRIN